MTMMNSADRAPCPVFIHSLYRAGSTYIFSVFRRSDDGYYCYQEPENEFLLHLNGDASKLLEMGNETTQNLRHPALGQSYFWEFYQVRGELSGLFRKSFSFDDFFADCSSGLTVEQTQYFGALITYAKGRPVLQMCRSAGRVGAFKQQFGGKHIHLWREPRNQWWSFKVNDYFDPAVQLIYNARQLPPVLAEIKRRCGIGEFHNSDVGVEFHYAHRSQLGTTENYLSFYALWLYAYLETEKYADVTLNIDALSAEESYREISLKRLADIGVRGLDFGDCSLPQASFSKIEDEFFQQIEQQVQALFIGQGYTEFDVDKARVARESASRQCSEKNSNLQRDAARAREITMRYLDRFAQAENIAYQAEEKAQQAEAKAQQAEGALNKLRNTKTYRILRWIYRLLKKIRKPKLWDIKQ